MKYNTFHQEQHPPHKAELVEQVRFRSVNFPYNAARYEFICPARHSLTYCETKPYRTFTGYLSQRRFYECEHCSPARSNPNALKSKAIAAFMSVLNSSGIETRRWRISCPSPEWRYAKNVQSNRRPCSGHQTQSRLSLIFAAGIEKVETEWGVLSIAHNLRKLAAQ
jgi:Transposase DDE domain